MATKRRTAAKEVILTFRTTERQAALFHAAADEERKSFSEWIRGLAMERAAILTRRPTDA